jgi:hypothetical protein
LEIELKDTYWENRKQENFFSGEQIKGLEKNCQEFNLKSLIFQIKIKKEVQKIILGFCENYEKLCQKKIPRSSTSH